MSKIEKKAQSIEDRVPRHRAGKVAPPAAAPAAPRPAGRDIPAKTEPSADMADRARPGREAPASAKPAGPSKGYVSGNTAVKEMQQAILNFASVAGSTDVTSMTGNKSGLQEGPQTTTAPGTDENGQLDPSKKTQEHLGGNDPFGEFIVDQYVATNPDGRQYLNVDVAGQKNRADASVETSSLRGMIDTISRVGTKGVNDGEKSADGVWASRTDNALAAILSLTGAMLNFARDLKVAVTYTDEKLKAFKTAVPKVYTAIPDKGAAAKKVTPFINEATKFFKELKKAVLNNRDIREYIDQKKPFAQYPKASKKTVKDILSPQEQSAFKTNQIMPLPNVEFVDVNGKNSSISLRELSDMESFKGFMKRIGKGKESENPAEVKKMLDAVMQQLSDPPAQKPVLQGTR